MDLSFAKIVTDIHGKDHILIEGRIYEIVGPASDVNPVVDAIVSRIRYGTFGSLSGGIAAGPNLNPARQEARGEEAQA